MSRKGVATVTGILMGFVLSSPIVTNGVVYVDASILKSDRGTLYAFGLK